jgi:ABC-2 type transport system permease protein
MIPALIHILRERWRDGRLSAVVLGFLLLSGTAIWLQSIRFQTSEHDRVAAQSLDRHTWENQGARNPHSVAHFSRFAFRPLPSTSALDVGITDYAGTAVWLEAHRQDPANARTAEDRLDLGRFVELSLSWLWQTIIPLLIIALGFDALSGERENGTLALVVATGSSVRRLTIGKALGLLTVLGAALLPAALIGMLTGPLQSNAEGQPWLRLSMWVVSYFLWCVFWVAIVLTVSLRARSSSMALLASLALWAISVVAVPRLASTTAEALAPALSAPELQARIERDLQDGMNGHDPQSARAKAFEAEVLAKYRVSSIKDLPVSFAGLSLAEGERYGNQVYDRRYGEVAEQYRRQRLWRRLAGLLTPTTVLQHLSMALAGTDIEHHLDFLQQAERHRRQTVSTLNEDMTLNGRGKDFDYLADGTLWKRIPDFNYALPSARTAVGHSGADALVLLMWTLVAVGALAFAARRAEGALS